MNPFHFFLDERERWFLWLPVAMAAGIAAYFALPFEPSSPWFIATPLLALIAFAARNRLAAAPLMAALLALALGFNAAQLETALITKPMLDHPLEPTSITGTLIRAEALPEGSRLTLSHPSIKGLPNEERPGLVRVKVRTAFADLPESGSRVNLWGPLWPPADAALPGGYDFRRSAFFKQIGATGLSYVELREREPLYPTPFFWDGFHLLFEKARRTLTLITFAQIENPEQKAMTAALLSGSQTAIDDNTMQAMRASGLSHLLSISGVHVSMMALLVYVPLRFLLALFPWIALRFSIKKWAAGVAIIATTLYTLLVGADAPTIRSALMTGLVMFAVIMDRKAMSLRLVALAALAIMLLDPSAAMGASFQMSFAAVLAMVAAYEKRLDATLGFLQDPSLVFINREKDITPPSCGTSDLPPCGEGNENFNLRSKLLVFIGRGLHMIEPTHNPPPSFSKDLLSACAASQLRRDKQAQEKLSSPAWGEAKNENTTPLPFGLSRLAHYLKDIILTSLIATAATTPFTIFHFQAFNFYGVIANMLAIPLTTLWVMPCLLLTYIVAPFGDAAWALHGAAGGVSLIIALAKTVAAWPYAQLYLPPLPAWALFTFLAGGLWLCLWRGRWRWAGLMPIAFCFIYPLTVTTPDVFIDADAPVWAARLSDGSMVAYGKRDENFTIAQWRQQSGNPDIQYINAKKPPDTDRDLFCDGAKCLYEKGGVSVMFLMPEVKAKTNSTTLPLRHAFAKATARSESKSRRSPQGEDGEGRKRDSVFGEGSAPANREAPACSTTTITVSFIPMPPCPNTVLIDRAALDKGGAHTITILPNTPPRITAVRTAQHARPWSVGWKKSGVRD